MTHQVPQTILAQLGGSRFIAMTGAKSFVGGERTLSFHLPSKITKHNAKAMRITLNDMDLYDLELLKMRKFEVTLVDKNQNIHVEDLRKTFTEMTGLDTSL